MTTKNKSIDEDTAVYTAFTFPKRKIGERFKSDKEFTAEVKISEGRRVKIEVSKGTGSIHIYPRREDLMPEYVYDLLRSDILKIKRTFSQMLRSTK